ncbi:5857_t:CDS:10 [Entrophospora sp. SA101]|nr:5857_t:CDS:10 [Entrophospora sp. SA101]
MFESNTDNDELNNLEKINAVLKKDVTHFKEREAILRKIQLYQAKISSAQYSFAGAAFEETKREKRAVEQLLQENQLVNDSKSEYEKIIIDATERKGVYSSWHSAQECKLQQLSNKLKRLNDKTDEIYKELSTIKRANYRGEQITQIRLEVSQLENSIKQQLFKQRKIDLQCEIDLSKSIKEKEIFLEETLLDQNLTQVLKDDGELGSQIQEKKDILRQTSDRLVTRRFDEIEEKKTYHCQESDKLINKLDDISQKMTLEEIRNAIDHEKENINLYNEVDPNIIDSYNERQAQIVFLRSQKEKRELSLKELNDEIAKEKEQWDPKLYELVRKIGELFSNAFNKIGCTGEVHINTHEDYDKWDINILERSVSTIMYLMALQELAKTPFCVVEINQGMDPKNEYLVHNHMIETSCHQPSQYFLITSELLSDCDLKYNAFTMLCFINNEEWQSERMN